MNTDVLTMGVACRSVGVVFLPSLCEHMLSVYLFACLFCFDIVVSLPNCSITSMHMSSVNVRFQLLATLIIEKWTAGEKKKC